MSWAPSTACGSATGELAAYWDAIQADPIAARLIAETRDAIAEQQAKSRALAVPP